MSALFSNFARKLALAAGISAGFASPAAADESNRMLLASADDVIITGHQSAAQEHRPTTSATVTDEQLRETVSVINAEDSLRYMPNIFVRKRHTGDTQAPITTRTSGVGASARSLIYADGVLLSALIGNNNSNASPKWGMAAPHSISRIDVFYGPFSAAYAGNSIGAVVEMQTRMPETFEGQIGAAGSVQYFEQYATKGDFGAHQINASLGNRFGLVSFWLNAQQTESDSQPLAYITATRPASPSGAGTPLTGVFADVNRTGAPIVVLGAGGFEHQVQDNVTLKTAWDVTPNTTIAYTLGRFGNDTESGAQTYLRDGGGAPVYSGGPFNIGGYQYTSIAASAFSNNVYQLNEAQWMNALTLTSSARHFDWRITASAYDYETSEQRAPSAALPGGFTGGAGTITRADGTNWRTLDLKGIYRPTGIDGDHEISFGAHGDRYELANNKYNTTNWISGAPGALASASLGKTETGALWAQDFWRLAPKVTLTTGLRWESWKAYDGLNYSLAPALNVSQPELSADKLSPKASLEWDLTPDWSARVSYGRAYRFPTVGELYQAITTGAVLSVPNLNLNPEKADSTEWTLRRKLTNGDLRLTFFTEDIEDALISQSGALGGSTVNFVQNVNKVRSRGLELVGQRDDVLIHGLSVSGSVTYVDPKIVEDAGFAAAVGKQIPQVPRWRATMVGTYRPDDRWAFTLAGRYSDRVYATIDNSDSVTHTYQGFDPYLVFDARANLTLNAYWTAALGIENLGAEDYFEFHPFPQRAATVELKYRF